METELKHMGNARTLKDLIKGITSEPQMISATGSFNETAAWINGFTAGLGEVGGPAYDLWMGFVRWLPLRLSYPENHWWSGELRRRYPEDAEAHKQLMALFDEYLSSRHNSDQG